MYPHIKLLKIISGEIQNIPDFIQKNKTDSIFIDLLLLLVSPEYTQKPNFELNITKKPPSKCITKNTKYTFTKFKLLFLQAQLINKFSSLLRYVNKLDCATKYTYLHIINRSKLPISIKELSCILPNYTFSKIEKVNDFGFPKFPCILQFVINNYNITNVSYTNNIINVKYLDGRLAKVTESIINDINKLSINNDFELTGYIYNNIYYIIDYYSSKTNNLKLVDRLKIISNIVISNELKYIKVIDYYIINSLDMLINLHYNKNTDNLNLLCRENRKVIFSKPNGFILKPNMFEKDK